MKKYIVIGNPIEHSLSPILHNHWIKINKIPNSIYEKKKIEKKDLEKIIDEVKKDELKGVNVTVPFKKEILPFLDELDEIAKKTLSVNTLVKINNKVWGHNTDVEGFKSSLSWNNFFDYKGKNIFILGAGGATSSIIYNFINSANKIYITNRTKKKAEALKELYSYSKATIAVIDWGKEPEICDLVINTTSVGLAKNENLDLNFKNYENNNKALFYDIIYNPEETNFLKNARIRGNKTMNGKMMFLHQARIAFKIWTGIDVDISNETIRLLDQ